jgi:uncharacterized protein (TIGR00645 family)
MDERSRPIKHKAAERRLESGFFGARWLIAPFYAGLLVALAVLLVVFVNELWRIIINAPAYNAEGAILAVLTLIDLCLAANLLLIVTLAGYENFVSKIDTAGHEDRPLWMGRVDFANMKMKLIASIVAISAISVLKAFMRLAVDGTVGETGAAPTPGLGNAGPPMSAEAIAWMVGIHLAFVISGVLLALMDWLMFRVERKSRP